MTDAGIGVNLHYIQFHPTALFHESGRFLISEALRGEGAKLTDVNGNNFMQDIHKDCELAPRDIVARGIHKTLINTNHPCVYLDYVSVHLSSNRKHG